jgi:hypothetical protein
MGTSMGMAGGESSRCGSGFYEALVKLGETTS